MKLYSCLAAYILLFFILISGCNNKPDQKIVPGWTSEILGPLVKTSINSEDLFLLQNFSGYGYLKLMDLGLWTNPTPLVKIPDTTFGSVKIPIVLNKDLESITFENGNLSFDLMNELDMDFKKGTTFILYNAGEVLLSDSLKEDLPKKSGRFSSIKTTLQSKTLASVLDLEIRNIGTHGSEFPIDIYDKKINITVNFESISVKELTLKPGRYSFSDTSAFNLNGRAVATESVSGDLYIYLKNNFSYNADLQFYFMSPEYERKDSLFSNPLPIQKTMPGEAERAPIKEPYVSSKSSNINHAKFINSVIKIYSDQPINIKHEEYLEAQIVGDLKFKVNN